MEIKNYIALVFCLLTVYFIALMVHVGRMHYEHGQMLDKLSDLTTEVGKINSGRK